MYVYNVINKMIITKGELMKQSKKFKVGMYGGKFMPFHKGHLYCVEYASKQCEKLYVILFYGSDQELEILKTRHEKWLQPEDRIKRTRKACEKIKNVIFVPMDVTKCKLPDGSQDWNAETDLVLNACGNLDAVYGSEPEYANYFAKAFPKATYVMIDNKRTTFPISGTAIRNMTNEEERKKWIV